MSDGLNRVTCLGNLGADAELKITRGGQAVISMSVACSESYLDRNKQRQERTEWVKCTLWGKRAEALAKYLSKGTRVYVEGSLRTSSYDDRDGNKRYKTEVNVTNIILCGGNRGGGSGGGGGSSRGSRDDAPTGGGGGGGDPYDDDPPSDRGTAPAGGGGAPDDDDIPFAPVGDVG